MLAVHNRLGGSITTTTASTSSATEPIPAPRHHLVHSPTPSPTPPFVLPRARVAGEELKRECGHVRKLEGMKGTTQLDIAVRFGKKFGKMGGGGGQRSSSGSAKRRKVSFRFIGFRVERCRIEADMSLLREWEDGWFCGALLDLSTCTFETTFVSRLWSDRVHWERREACS